MLKKTILFLFVIFILFSSLSVFTLAQDADFVIQDGVLVRYNGSGGDVVVPDGITSIGESAFANFVSVTSVTMPNSTTTIAQSAFSKCINLRSIHIPNSVISIDDYAFEACSSLESVIIPYSVERIGIAAFAQCQSLYSVDVDEKNLFYSSINEIMFDKKQTTLLLYPAGRKEPSFTIPSDVTSIGENAFTDCAHLASIVIPNSVKTIGAHAFDSCSKLSSIEIPNSVNNIGEFAFCNTQITSIELPNSITNIADYLFSFCGKLVSVTIPDSVTHIGKSAFQDCNILPLITIPNSVSSIGFCAFQGCSSLSTITIPNSVTNIDNNAFSLCPSLTSIIIPDSVKNIGRDMFYQSDRVTIYGINNSYAQEYAVNNYIKFAELIIREDGSIELDSSTVTQSTPPPVKISYDAAAILNKLGLFNGVGVDAQGDPIFELERIPTRQEVLVMLIRLLGMDKTALASINEHPFDDVAVWAEPYVGYAFSKGLTNGISQNKFGSDELASLQQYSTFLLRALGYSETDNDFTYATAIDTADELGIIDLSDSSLFNRGSVAELSYRTLLLPPKGEDHSLANKLLWKDVFTTDQLDETHDGKLMLAADMPDLITTGVTVYNLEDLHNLILLSMKNNQTGIDITVPGFSGHELEAVCENIIKNYHWKALMSPNIKSWNNYISPHMQISNYLMLEYYYENPLRYKKNYQFYRKDLIEYTGVTVTLAGWVHKVDGIIKDTITSSMRQKDKVKALHDYLILNTVYDRAAEGDLSMSPHFANQIIFEGYGVCDGYSEAFKILMNAAGIECKVIYGDTPYGLHAWNQVKIDGVWYNMDVTWDDPDDGARISYDYYCVSDEEFLKEHEAEEFCNREICPYTLER